MAQEELVWQSRPSLITNLGFYAVSLLKCWLVAPIF